MADDRVQAKRDNLTAPISVWGRLRLAAWFVRTPKASNVKFARVILAEHIRREGSGEPACPSCGESPMFRSVVHGCCVDLQTVIAPAKRILARLHNSADVIDGDDVMALESAIERAEIHVH